MKNFKQGIAFIHLLIMTNLYAPQFIPVQVSKFWKLTDAELKKIATITVDNVVYNYPNFLDYVTKNPPPFLDEKLKGPAAFDEFPSTKLFEWLNDAMNVVKKEPFMQKTHLRQQKNIGVTIIDTVTNALLERFCTTNEALKDDAGRLATIRGNVPIQINSYLSMHWIEDWLTQARDKMVWTQLSSLFEATGNNVDAVFEKQTDPYPINTEWLCNALKAAQLDITLQQKSSDSDLVAYCTSSGKKGTQSPYIAPALKDAKDKIVNKAIELITPQLPTDKTQEEKTQIIEEIKSNIRKAFTQCIYQKEVSKDTQKWVNLNDYLEKNKVSTETVDNKEIGTLTDEWLKGAIDAAKQDRDTEKMNAEVTLREATRKISDAIPNIQDNDYGRVGTAVENELKKKTTGEQLLQFGAF